MKQMLQLSPVPARVKFLTKPIGVYIHIPFCRKRCAYCDFYTAMCHNDVIADYVKRLKEQIIRWGAALSRPADTVYFGGGTPSVLGEKRLCELLDTVKSAFSLSENAEITVEINPEDANDDFLCGIKNGGFNRLSIGFQSLDDNVLKNLGRRHSAADAENAFYMARKAGFDNITADVMLALPFGSTGQGIKTVEKLLKLSPEHISCYMLILEEKTALYAKKTALYFPDEESVEKEYLQVSRILQNAGYTHYEISNFAKPGKESRHNLKYWQTKEYIGIGPSAYSYIDGKRFSYKNDLKGFINCPETAFDSFGGDLYEYVMLGLRLKIGIDEDSIKKNYSKCFSSRFKEKAELLLKNELCCYDGKSFSLTEKGMLVSNSVICQMTEDDMYEDI